MKSLLVCSIFFVVPLLCNAKDVNYDINIDYKVVNLTGKEVKAIALSKKGEAANIPAPTLEFTEGDIAIITIQNNLNEETSIHWHGLLVPNDQDGVPHLTTPPIKAHSTFTYRFPLKHSGTYWYHSHTGLQEQRGVFGAIVIHPKVETLKYSAEQVLVLSDWTNRNPEQILNNLKMDTEWEQICKGTRRGWLDDIKEGTIKERLQSEKNRMGPMDIADVCYDAFLVNGKKSINFANSFKPGQKIRLRVINAGSSTYFHLAFGKQPLQVVAADGMAIQSVLVSDLLMGMAETYDVIITVPTDKLIELRATSADVTGMTSVFFGVAGAPVEYAPTDKRPNPYGMNMPMDGSSSGDSNKCKSDEYWDEGMKMCMPKSSNPMKLKVMNSEPACEPGEPGCDELFPLTYNRLKSVKPTTLPNAPTKEIQLDLTGDMFSYVWSFNNTVLGDADVIKIDKGTNVRIKFVNYTMMHHPLHLHGHFFRVLNGQNEFSPLKHTVDVAPMETVTIEFYANEEKDWVLHCHNLYHMVTGMTRIFSYNEGKTYSPNDMAAPPFKSSGDHMKMAMEDMSGKQWYSIIQGGVTNAAADAQFKAANDQYQISIGAESDYQGKDYEIRTEGAKKINPNLKAGIGVQRDNDGNAGRVFVNYRLPFLVDATMGYGNRGLDYGVAKEFALKGGVSFDTKYGREYGLQKYGAFLKWRWKQNISFKAGIAERQKFEIGIEVRK